MKIKSLIVSKPFKYLWLKTVENINLNVHCAKCLVGKYDNRISPYKKQTNNIELQDKIYYLCGVSAPYVWKNNFHLAFKPLTGNTIEVNELGIHIVVEDAEMLPISVDFINKDLPMAKYRDFHTCRNWQFANYLASMQI